MFAHLLLALFLTTFPGAGEKTEMTDRVYIGPGIVEVGAADRQPPPAATNNIGGVIIEAGASDGGDIGPGIIESGASDGEG